jgi:heterodisulfide reductase subunit A
MAGHKGNGNGGGNGDDLRIGVYICHCGLNIASKVDVEALAAFGRTLPGVVVSQAYKFMCSDPGQQLIRDDIARNALNRVVVASCSPLMHEPTFRKVLLDAGVNPYFYQMANIREQVSWVTEDSDKATAKAKRLLAAAVRRVALHDALEKRQVPVNPDVLVVGGGIAGITAALLLADSGKQVYLVEREPSIGGHMAHFDKTFPTLDCAACILTPKMVAVDKHPNIHLMTYSEVEDVAGYVGNFTVKVRHKSSYVDPAKCTGCGLCWETCPATRIPSTRVIRMGTRVVGAARPAKG